MAERYAMRKNSRALNRWLYLLPGVRYGSVRLPRATSKRRVAMPAAASSTATTIAGVNRATLPEARPVARLRAGHGSAFTRELLVSRRRDVNAYLRKASGGNFTAKDFRTWAGTVTAARALSGLPPFDSRAQAKTNIVQVIESIAKRLGHTPAMCRKSYIHPSTTRPPADSTDVMSDAGIFYNHLNLSGGSNRLIMLMSLVGMMLDQ